MGFTGVPRRRADLGDRQGRTLKLFIIFITLYDTRAFSHRIKFHVESRTVINKKR